jgi:ABC-type antimicrobial peptide transport system ATPase subunit
VASLLRAKSGGKLTTLTAASSVEPRLDIGVELGPRCHLARRNVSH